MTKPRTAAGYESVQVRHVRAACLYLATKLGDLLDELVVVGGLVPSLLVDQAEAKVEKHVGTLDLDIGMEVAILDDKRYEVLTERLRAAGFEPDENEKGNQTCQRATIRGEEARRQICVCGAGAFVVMKALAFRSRGENKDAYDITYLLRNFGTGPSDVAARLLPHADRAEVKEAIRLLSEDFETVDSIGPRRVSEFLFDARHDETQADALGAVRDLLDVLGT